MSLEIKPAHLQYVFSLMTAPLDYPHFFYSDTEIFRNFFNRMDKKATYRKIKQTKNLDIEPSYFGEIIIMYSEYAFLAEEQENQVEKEAIEKYTIDAFLNLAAWYILALLEAAKRKCPYMPNSWTNAFLTKIEKMDKQTYESYIEGVLSIMMEVDSKSWLTPYKDIGSQLGKNAQDSLLILVGMFLEAYEEQKGDETKSDKNTPQNNSYDLDPAIVEFLENIRAVDKLSEENKENPPLN